MIFANAIPEANAFLQVWLVVGLIATVVGNICAVVMGFLNFKRTQKRDVTLNTGFASAVSFAELGQKVESMRTERRKDISDLHEKINGVSHKVSTLEGQTEFMRQDVLSIDAKVDRLLERK